MQLSRWASRRLWARGRGRQPGVDETLPVIDGVTFRRHALGIGAAILCVLVVGRLVMSELAAARRTRMIVGELTRFTEGVGLPHHDYLEPRIGLGRELTTLLAAGNVAPQTIRAIATAGTHEFS